jgi:hypothetical protein
MTTTSCGPAHFLALGLSLACLAAQAVAGDANASTGQWHPGMTAVFSGFLCNEPVDAVNGLVAALTLPGASPIEEFAKLEEPLHCFFSDGPVKFLGRVPDSKVFVDPQKGRFLFVAFDIGGKVTAYSWIGEAFVADGPRDAPGRTVDL